MDEIEKNALVDNKKYVFTILKIIFLTNIPALFFLIVNFESSIGWMTGSLASAVNFWFMARKTLAILPEEGKANAFKTAKLFVIRYMFLIVWSLLILYFLKPELMAYCLGLLAAQIAIFLYQIYLSIRYGKYKKYFRGDDE